MTRTRQWLIAGLALGATLGLALVAVLVTPRAPAHLQAGRPQSFRYTFDPHLFLEVTEASRPSTETGGGELKAKLRVSNTAVGDLRIALQDLRVATRAPDGRVGEPARPQWTLASGEVVAALPPGSTATATVRLALQPSDAGAALLIWEENTAVRLLPFARGSLVCPALLYRFEGEEDESR